MTLLQIVPNLEPEIGGVRGYAAALGRALAELGLESRVQLADRDWPRGAEAPGRLDPAAARRGARGADLLARRLTDDRATIVLLHYVNYGYERRGCPRWLVDGVTRWRAGAPGRRLVTYFHEVHASGPPWRSSFWTHLTQRRLAARLLRASDAAATGTALYGRILERWRPSPPVVEMPVFSTVGEPAAVPPPEQRQPRTMLVFGGAGNRRRAYGELRQRLAIACSALGIAEILDVGPPFAGQPQHVDGVPVKPLGTRPDREVSALLLRSYAGFLGFPAALLGKSTVFAAYCAHGLVPVCVWMRRRLARVPLPGPPFWAAGWEPAPADPADLAARARAWYAGHDLAHQAVRFHALFGSLGAGEAAPSAAGSRRPSTRTLESAAGRPPP